MNKEQVNHPEHYNKGGIECIDAMLSSKGCFKVLAFCECDTFKYNWRQGLKDSTIQELRKQNWYNNKQIDLLTKIESNPKAKKLFNQINKLTNQLDELLQL